MPSSSPVSSPSPGGQPFPSLGGGVAAALVAVAKATEAQGKEKDEDDDDELDVSVGEEIFEGSSSGAWDGSNNELNLAGCAGIDGVDAAAVGGF